MKHPSVPAAEAAHLLAKYSQAVELIKRHRQQQQASTQQFLAVLQNYLASKDTQTVIQQRNLAGSHEWA